MSSFDESSTTTATDIAFSTTETISPVETVEATVFISTTTQPITTISGTIANTTTTTEPPSTETSTVEATATVNPTNDSTASNTSNASYTGPAFTGAGEGAGHAVGVRGALVIGMVSMAWVAPLIAAMGL
ncbi:MAG: hypothetical protein Q9160_001508 [Pyrenula sp. 1 TL-2023]